MKSDSGASVWNKTANWVVGMVSAGGRPVRLTPLLTPKGKIPWKVPGAFKALSDQLGKPVDLIEAP